MTVELVGVPTPRVDADHDLLEVLLDGLTSLDVALVDGDVLCVASKVVAITEGRTVPLDDDPTARRALAMREAATIVAESPQVVITRTQHGFVCANDGIDASNAALGTAILLPVDPDASAADLREQLRQRLGIDVGIVVTDTFGRPWREGQTEVALGVAGITALRDERGGHDLFGRELVVTMPAIADEIAGAADLVRSKDASVPFVLVRGLDVRGDGTGADLVRDLDLDLFRWGGPTAVEQAVAGRRTVRRFSSMPVDEMVIDRAVAAMVTAPAPHHTRPWRVIALRDDTRTRLLDAMADDWQRDLAADGLGEERISQRVATSDAVLREAPVLLATFVDTSGSHDYPDPERSRSERDLFMLAGGAGLQNLMIVAAGHGVGTAWMSSTTFCAATVRRVLDLPDSWEALGMVALGHPAGPSGSRVPPESANHWRWA